jgi:hypothetical protein
MLPVAIVRDRGPAAGLRRAAVHARAATRGVLTRPSRFVIAWTGVLGLGQVAALCVGLAAQGRPLPHPAAALVAAVALAVIAGLCLGMYLFVRMLGAGGTVAAVTVTAAFYGFCVTGSSEPGWLPALALWPIAVGLAPLLARGPWAPLPARPHLPRA